MKFYPNSLLGRTLLLLMIIVVFSHFLSGLVFKLNWNKVDESDLKEIVTDFNVIHQAMTTLPQPMADQLLLPFSDRIKIVHLASGTAPGESLDTVKPNKIKKYLKQKLPKKTQARLGTSDNPGIWIQLPSSSFPNTWALFPYQFKQTQLPTIFMLILLSNGLLIVLGAFLLVSRVNRPLQQLIHAADDLGKGKQPALLIETGPKEISALSRSFNQMVENIKTMQAEQTFTLAAISHDLRTPLTRLRLGVEMLANHKDDKLYQGLINDLTDMDHIIQQFLDFIRDGTREVAEEVNAVELCDHIAAQYQREGVTLNLQLGQLPVVWLRPLSMQRAITNLIDNAIKYGAPPITLAAYIVDNMLCIDVIDCGSGIALADTERLQKPFTQHDTARGASGSGLGLAIVNKVAALHQGRFLLLPNPAGTGLCARMEINV